MTSPLVTYGVGKRYRRRWALRDCSLTIPERGIVGLAGPNGAGSTLLGLTVGLLARRRQSQVLGRDPRLEPEVLTGVGFVARAPVPLVHRRRRSSSRGRPTPAGTPRSRASS
jgi:ABC-2 type transport system ATP-binding protein